MTGISSLIKYSGMSPVHWDWTDSPSNLKDKMETSIEETFVRRTDVSSPISKILKFYLRTSASVMSTLTRICTQNTS